MAKGDKALKGLKAAKGAKSKLFSRAQSEDSEVSPSAYYGHVGHDDVEESSDGWLSAFEPSASLTYSDLFDSSTQVQQRNDFGSPGHVTSSEFKANGGSPLISGRMGGPEAPT